MVIGAPGAPPWWGSRTTPPAPLGSYAPARRQPVWPAASESASFCAVRYGALLVPGLESDPLGAASLSQPALASGAHGLVAASTDAGAERLPAPSKASTASVWLEPQASPANV